MPPMPARCRSCGLTFDGQGGIHADASIGLTVVNVKITCPRCGNLADVIEGRFDVTSGGIEMIEGPQWSLDVINELGLALVRAQDLLADGVKPKVVERRLRQELSDDEKSFLEKHFPRDARMEFTAWLAVVLAILIPLLMSGGDEDQAPGDGAEQIIDDQTDLIERYQELVEHYEQVGEVPPAPPLPPMPGASRPPQ